MSLEYCLDEDRSWPCWHFSFPQVRSWRKKILQIRCIYAV